MYMTRRDVVKFEWDKGNIDKNYQKHGITPNEAEEVFLDERALTFDDVTHSFGEKRFDMIGMTSGGAMVFLVFTMRGRNVRIISARLANNKERRLYEEKNI